MLKQWPVEHRLPGIQLRKQVSKQLMGYYNLLSGEESETSNLAIPQLMRHYHTHQGSGAFMYVSKQVTDDLLRSDIPDPDFASLVWPANTLQITFEDPALPVMMVSCEFTKILQWAMTLFQAPDHYITDMVPKPGVMILSRSADGTWCGLGKDYPEMDLLARGVSDEEDLESMGGVSADLFSWLALLLFKILMFAATPKFSPSVKKVRFDKPPIGHLSRPKMDQYIVEYLPHHITEKKAEAEKCGTSHSFRGRRGHFRVYIAERFVNKRGDRDYIYPVPNPHGDDVKRKFIVRKP